MQILGLKSGLPVFIARGMGMYGIADAWHAEVLPSHPDLTDRDTFQTHFPQPDRCVSYPLQPIDLNHSQCDMNTLFP